ncbi:MAG TPA: HDIG domain-containing protein [Syntrophales bacterium]|nr:HDIG domain-containing protein [Syntrophales bacterium]
MQMKWTLSKRKKKTGGGRRSLRSWFENSQSFRIVLFMVSGIVLTYFLIPSIPWSVPNFKEGMIAVKDVKADRDYLVVDRAMTEKKRLEAADAVTSVYDYDRSVPARIGLAVAGAFLEASGRNSRTPGNETAATRGNEGPAGFRKDFEAALGVPVGDGEFGILSRRGFSFETMNNLARVAYVPYLTGPVSRDILPAGRAITIREIRTGAEELREKPEGILSLEQARSRVREYADGAFRDLPPDLREVFIALGGRMIRPNLTFAGAQTEKRKTLAMEEVKPVLFRVQAGEMIVREGEKITAGQMDKLQALHAGREGHLTVRISKASGTFLAILLSILLLYLFLRTRLKPSTAVNIDLLTLALVSLLMVILAKIGIFVSRPLVSAFPLIPLEGAHYAIPFMAGTMIVVVLLKRDAGFVFSLFLAFLVSFLFEARFSMFLYVLTGGIVSTFRLSECRERSAFYRTGFVVGIVNMVVILCLSLLSNTVLSLSTLMEVAFGLLSGLFSGILAGSLMPLFEFLLGYTTDIKLLELANLNRPVFRQMIFSTPGTYHHSIVVGSMVEAAAEAIRANPLLAKVSAYYHDIGKMKKPLYYVENQQKWEDRHQKLSPKMSSLVIISHVKEGCELAAGYRLGRQIIDIIRQHHGTRLVTYFYDKAKKDRDPSIRSIPESDFRYPGPKPRTREAALVLLGDVVEASSRALTNPTSSRIRNLVEDRIMEVLHEGQLDESELTFQELHIVQESFVRILMGIFHHRIDYPSQPPLRLQNGKKERNGDPSRQPPGKDSRVFTDAPSGPH